jgi:hypothetical protein
MRLVPVVAALFCVYGFVCVRFSCFFPSYSIEQSVDDLNRLLLDVVYPMMGRMISSSTDDDDDDDDDCCCSPYHLYGHSFGGVLVYEYLQRCYHYHVSSSKRRIHPLVIEPVVEEQASSEHPSNHNNNNNNTVSHHDNHHFKIPQSVILSNTPTDLGRCNDDYDRLYGTNPFTFWKRHVICNNKDGWIVPPSLQDAMTKTGNIWVGMDVVSNYRAKPLSSSWDWNDVNGNNDDEDDEDAGTDSGIHQPSMLVISASNDFAHRTSNEGVWKSLLVHSRTTTNLDSNNDNDSNTKKNRDNVVRFVNFDDDCGHYPFYEKRAVAETYGKVISEFLQDTKYIKRQDV